jgi:hypothetical protein
MRSLDLALVLAALAACGDQTGYHEAPVEISGYSGIPTMNPGIPCMCCHSAKGSAGDCPANASSNAVHRPWTVAGTVYDRPDAGSDAGVAGAEVLITDSNNRQLTLVTNEAGNFYTGEALLFPLTDVQIQRGTKRMVMNLRAFKRANAPDPSGDCNSCHNTSAQPGGVAVGRLFVP